ncbi:unnamed protein product [Leptosia nina]|uniref:unspecific monooxygenase n=1 Tax=Leptosia nina TaxID=320188 RepID=A0AAV1J6I4_9NEOP
MKHDPPIPVFGNHMQVSLARLTETEKFTYIYNKFTTEKVVGYYRGSKPEFVVRDPDIIRNILSVNFLEFHNRGLRCDSKVDLLTLSMFSEQGNVWKLLRNNLAPAFSYSKIKAIFPIIVIYTKLAELAHNLAERRDI